MDPQWTLSAEPNTSPISKSYSEGIPSAVSPPWQINRRKRSRKRYEMRSRYHGWWCTDVVSRVMTSTSCEDSLTCTLGMSIFQLTVAHHKKWGVSQAYTTSFCWWWALLLIYTVSDLVIRPTVFGVFLVISGQFTAAFCRNWTLAVLDSAAELPSPPFSITFTTCIWSLGSLSYNRLSGQCAGGNCLLFKTLFTLFMPCKQIRIKTSCVRTPSFCLIPYYFIPFLWLENFKNYIKIWSTDHVSKRQWKLHPKSLPCVNLVWLSQSVIVWFYSGLY